MTAKRTTVSAASARVPPTHHIDRRANALVIEGDDDTLISTSDLADLLGLSEKWCQMARSRGYGPPWVRISQRCVRYRLGAVRLWLAERCHAHTKEYTRRGSDEPGRRVPT